MGFAWRVVAFDIDRRVKNEAVSVYLVAKLVNIC